jgi:hypothetical protein
VVAIPLPLPVAKLVSLSANLGRSRRAAAAAVLQEDFILNVVVNKHDEP